MKEVKEKLERANEILGETQRCADGDEVFAALGYARELQRNVASVVATLSFQAGFARAVEQAEADAFSEGGKW